MKDTYYIKKSKLYIKKDTHYDLKISLKKLKYKEKDN